MSDGPTRRREALRLLLLPDDPSDSDVQRAFRARARAEHPDHHDEADRVHQTQRMAALNAAREFLLSVEGREAGRAAAAYRPPPPSSWPTAGQPPSPSPPSPPWRPGPGAPQEPWDPTRLREQAARSSRRRAEDALRAERARLEGPPDLLVRGLVPPVPGGHRFVAPCGCVVQAVLEHGEHGTSLVHGVVQVAGSGCEHWDWLTARHAADRHVELLLDRRQWRTGGVFVVDGVPVRVLPRQAPTTLRLPGLGEPGHRGPAGHLQVHVVHVDRSGQARRRPFVPAPPVGWSMLAAALVGVVGVWLTSLVV